MIGTAPGLQLQNAILHSDAMASHKAAPVPRKAVSPTIWLLITIALAIIVLVVILLMTYPPLSRAGNVTGTGVNVSAGGISCTFDLCGSACCQYCKTRLTDDICVQRTARSCTTTC